VIVPTGLVNVFRPRADLSPDVGVDVVALRLVWLPDGVELAL